MSLKKHNLLMGLMLAVLLVPGAHALEGDRQQPLRIQADSAVLNEKDGTATYSGNVVLTQGSLTIKASRLHIQTVQGKVSVVTAEGKPARFSQVPGLDQPPVEATALTVDYQVKDQTLILRRKASVVQNENVFKGEEIVYEIQSQRLKAQGQTKETPKGEAGTGRVEMILPSAGELAPETAPKPGAGSNAPATPAPSEQPAAEPVPTSP